MDNQAKRLFKSLSYALVSHRPTLGTAFIISLSLVPAALTMADIMTITFPFRAISHAFMLWSLFGIWYVLNRLAIAATGDRKKLIGEIIVLSLLLGLHAATIIAIHILKIYYAPGIHHYPTLAVSLLSLGWISLAIMRRSVRLILAEGGKPIRAAAHTVITAFTGEKIEQAVSFLNDNYKFDISREGLAEKLGMSVDHLSRKFKAYMGRRMGDYVNELRVRDAAESLRYTGGKIIDIAYDNGFESLATFNRVFLKTMGETPTEYRRRYSVAMSAPAQETLHEFNQFFEQPLQPE